MRNLKKYPISLKEILDGLESMEKEFSTDGAIGDMRPIILAVARTIVLRTGFAIDGIKP